ncbi:hypothetical protein HBH64_056400 [Parastagonospora nodorum]|nr:hypothetical protein HBH53_216420 [Parastagonospora nodorum]KAH3998236.1 hypothetical protein HBI10_129850 [Parastagonospora nodorum]KAH4030167.1 hypothetical protein HBI13_037730 [Parastagonospora nodorum]KAH4236539.1 hypothetical protein HBI06_052410 [Parastagonospora nodorum]KAH4248685.1 hypothetical protein HBI05_022750 [Parastagonospora nodorum]
MTAVAPVSSHDVHPLLRHPRPITRDSAKAQRMLGLIADTEEKSNGLHRAQSKTTKWLERPFYAHQDVSDIESGKEEEEDFEKRPGAAVDGRNVDKKDAHLLEHWADRPTSFSSEDAVRNSLKPKTKLDASFNKPRPGPLTNLRPVSYTSQHLLTPDWTASPATMHPNSYRRPNSLQPASPSMHRSSFSSSSSNSDSMPQFSHPQTWPVQQPHQQRTDGQRGRPASYQPPSAMSRDGSYSPLGGSHVNDSRPRPTSFATYHHRERRKSKIASSRGLRNNSYPNFSRPISEAGPTATPEQHDATYNRLTECEVGPPSPSFPVRAILDGFDNGKSNDDKKPKKRWSAIPESIKKFTTSRRSSGTTQDPPTPETTMEALRRMNLTEDNLTRYQGEVKRTSVPPSRASTLGVNLLPTPTHSPLELKHTMLDQSLPPPFAPWADEPLSPTVSSQEQRDNSLSPSKKGIRSRLSVDNFKRRRPESMQSHSRKSSLGMPSPTTLAPPPHTPTHAPTSPRPTSRRGATPSLERACIICKTSQDLSAFINHQISGNCWHEPATCIQCLKSHIERCVTAQGWDHCNCPECGELISYDDMAAFAEDGIVKWED